MKCKFLINQADNIHWMFRKIFHKQENWISKWDQTVFCGTMIEHN